MTDERLLFDRKLLRERRARFAHEIAARELVLAHVAREIAERVELMLRPFPLALDLGRLSRAARAARSPSCPRSGR